MCLVRMAVYKRATPIPKDINDLSVNQDSCNDRIASSKAFGDSGNIRNDILLLKCEICPAASGTAHNLVQCKENTVYITKRPGR